MSPKKIVSAALLAFVAISIGYLVVTESRTTKDAPLPGGDEPVVNASVAGEKAAAHKVIAYYLHSTQRCPTCLKIERIAADTLKARFAGELQRGELEWHVLNMEEAPNEHFVKDYALVTSSLVIVDSHDGRQRAWTNMERVWEFVHDDETAFADYVAEKVREYLES